MTENKRFTYSAPFDGFCDVYDNGKLLSCMRLEYVENTVNRLNELNNENTHIKTIIKEMYETERTALGRSVLKQLLDSLE
jgi:hypothetical protein